MVLCPISFLVGFEQNVLGDIAPQPAPIGQAGIQALDTMKPMSGTFVHELFHWAPYPQQTNPVGGEECEQCRWKVRQSIYTDQVVCLDNLNNILALPAASAIQNPESYYFFVIGSWYSYNKLVPDPFPNGPPGALVVSREPT